MTEVAFQLRVPVFSAQPYLRQAILADLSDSKMPENIGDADNRQARTGADKANQNRGFDGLNGTGDQDEDQASSQESAHRKPPSSDLWPNAVPFVIDGCESPLQQRWKLHISRHKISNFDF